MGYKPKIVIVHSTGTETQEATNSGYLGSLAKPTYAEAHDLASAGDVGNNFDFYCSQLRSTTSYFIERGGVIFPVSTGLTVTSATVKLYGLYFETDDGHFDATLVDGSDLADTLVAADYGELLNEVTSYGLINTANCVTEAWNSIELNATGLTALKNAIASGKFRLGLRHSKDISNTAPSAVGDDYAQFYGSNALTGGLFIPKIIII